MFSSLIKNKKYMIGAGAAVLLIAGGTTFLIRSNGGATVTVTRGDIVQTVSATGKMKPRETVDLAFDRSGKVVSAPYDIGTVVRYGQTIASLDQQELLALRAQKEAALAGQQAQLDEMKKGTRPEDLAVSENEVANAQVALSDAATSLSNVLTDSFTKSDDIVRNNIDQLFSNPRSASPEIISQVVNNDLRSQANAGRRAVETMLIDWEARLASLSLANTTAITTAKQNLQTVRGFLDVMTAAANSLLPNSNLTQTTIDAYRTVISGTRTTASVAISALSTAEEKWNTAQSNLTLAQRKLEVKQAGSTPEAIAAQVARVAQAQADVDAADAQLSQTILWSPLNGVITKQDAKVGQIVTAGTPVVSVIANDAFYIDSDISEVHIGKVKVGDAVSITFDAFPGESFKGKVVYIDPGETLVDGVVHFRIKITLDTPDPRFKSGITANLSIETNRTADVVVVPKYVVVTTGDTTTVSVKKNGRTTSVPVTLGASGDDGSVEIKSGLSEGDIVVVPNAS